MSPTVGFHVPNIRKIFVNTSVSTRKDDAVKRQRGVKILLQSFLTLGCIRKYVLSFTALLLYFRRNAGCIPESVSKRWRKGPPPTQQVFGPRISGLPVRVHSPMYAAWHFLCSKTPSSRTLVVDCVKDVAIHRSFNTEY